MLSSMFSVIGPAQIESLKNAAQEFCQCGTEKLKEWRDKNEYVGFSLFVCVCVCAHARTCMCECVHMYACACVFVSVCVCVPLTDLLEVVWLNKINNRGRLYQDKHVLVCGYPW